MPLGAHVDHAEVRERLADAASEIGWQDRLAAEEGRELREHLAGCVTCRADAAAWTRTTDALRAAAPLADARELAGSTALSGDLRARTIALVRAAGVQRDGAPRAAPAPAAPREAYAQPPAFLASGRTRWPWRRLGVLAAAAAVVLLAGGATGLQLIGQRDQAQADVADLTHLTATLDQVLSDPSRQVVTLASAPGGGPGGTVAWSAASSELVVISDALAPAPEGQLYRCWVERNGVRTSVGRMRFTGSIAYWAGQMDSWGGTLAHGDRFGVSLASASASGGGGGDPVLFGTF